MSVSEAFQIGTRFAKADSVTVACRDIAVHLSNDLTAVRLYHDGKKRILPFTRLSKYFNRENGHLTYTLYDRTKAAAQTAGETHDLRSGMRSAFDDHPAVGILRDICANNNVHMDVLVDYLPGFGVNHPPEFWARIVIRTLTPYTAPAPAATPVAMPAPAPTPAAPANGLRDGLTLNAPRFVISKPPQR